MNIRLGFTVVAVDVAIGTVANSTAALNAGSGTARPAVISTKDRNSERAVAKIPG